MTAYQKPEIEQQINHCLNLLKDVLGKDLLGVYLYGSAIVGGLQKYSDIDLFVVTDRATTYEEKAILTASLLQISGVYMKTAKLPIEITLVNKSEINPWLYPPNFDFQYGDWLRQEFESGNMEPWSSKAMPELALLITQVLLANKTLLGPHPNQLLSPVPYKDFIKASVSLLDNLQADLNSDTRNVLLAYARIWSTVETDSIRSKPDAAEWALYHLPREYRLVMSRAKSICMGELDEYWDDISSQIQPCAVFILNRIKEKILEIELSSDIDKCIKLAN